MRKGKLIIFTLIIMMWLMIMPNAKADVASGTFGTCSWNISDNGVLLIKPTSGNECTLDSMTGYEDIFHGVILPKRFSDRRN